jgi:hypothetical protein
MQLTINGIRGTCGKNSNGWTDWKNKDGEPIGIYRKINKD